MRPQPIIRIFDNAAFDDHEQVVFCSDTASGLKAIIAVHSTALGPALGGCRMWDYTSEADAVIDALRLSRGMTYKNALAGLDHGGGKSVVLGDAARDKTPEMLQAFGRAVERLAGRYITAEDVGIGTADVEQMRTQTTHVRGIAEGGIGDPSPHTAFGVFCGLKAAAAHAFGSDDLTGLRVVVQGLGSVGMALACHLHEAGAELAVADINSSRVAAARDAFGASAVEADRAHAAEADIYAPCALGAVLNARSIPELRVRAVAGAANNQIETDADGDRLRRRGILYAPDYVINAGGVIAISHEGPDHDPARLRRHLEGIGATLSRVFKTAGKESRPTSTVADALAEQRLLQKR